MLYVYTPIGKISNTIYTPYGNIVYFIDKSSNKMEYYYIKY